MTNNTVISPIEERLREWTLIARQKGWNTFAGASDGFMANIAKACGGIDTAGTGMNVDIYNAWRTGDMRQEETTIYVFPSQDRAKAFLELLQWISWYGEAKQATGVERGHNLLIQLNEGELAMGDFDRRVQDEKNRAYTHNPWPEGAKVQ